MLKLFLRLYLFLMLPATAAFVFFMYVTDQVMTQMHAEEQRARAGVAFDRAERIISDQRVPDWQGRLKEIEKTFRVEHEIVPFDKASGDFFLSSSEKERLKSGAIAFRDRPGGGTVYMRRIKDSDRVLRIEWVGAYEYLVVYHAIILALVMMFAQSAAERKMTVDAMILEGPGTRTIEKGDQSNVDDAKQVLVRTEAEWTRLWQQHNPDRPRPKVDFSK